MADAPVPGRATFKNCSVSCQSVDSFTGLCLAGETHQFPQRSSCETCMISDHIFHVLKYLIRVMI